MQIDEVLGLSRELYVGRTCFPERRLLEHFHNTGRPYLGIIEWVCGKNEAKVKELELITKIGLRTVKIKNDPDDDESRGKISSHWNCIFISFSLKNSAPRISIDRSVKEIRNDMRLWPDTNVQESNIMTLFCDVTKDNARKLVDDHIRALELSFHER
jgi:hypothetical protein